MAPPLYLDHTQTALNPCSLETIPEPVPLPDGTQIWPCMISCYELLPDQNRRVGLAQFHPLLVPDISNSFQSSLSIQFNKPQHLIEGVSGILDGKWARSPTDLQRHQHFQSFWFATAHADGEIRIHSLNITPNDDDYVPSLPPWSIDYMGKSDHLGTGLCLSLNWDASSVQDSSTSRVSPTKIVSTYSSGHAAIHDVAYFDDRVELVCRDSWKAHSLFQQSPAEVWSADFVNDTSVVTAGDEGKLKMWDIRSINRPTQVLEPFQAGATCVAAHPRLQNIFACGSYDETLCIYDQRMLPRPLYQTKELGGGIWRIKWHPYSDDRILVGAMHGGCRVLRAYGSLGDKEHDNVYSAPVSVKVKKEFTEHKSMAYGADWIVCKHPTQDGYFEAAASCSFYDRNVFLWDSVL